MWPEKIAKCLKKLAKMISLEKRIILTPLQKLPKNVRDLGKLIVAKGFKKLPKVQKITQSGHTECLWLYRKRVRVCVRESQISTFAATSPNFDFTVKKTIFNFQVQGPDFCSNKKSFKILRQFFPTKNCFTLRTFPSLFDIFLTNFCPNLATFDKFGVFLP